MSTMTGNKRRAILSGVVGTVIAVAAVGMARADVASDKPGAILIFPKIVVDTSGRLGPPTDTEIQITNTSNSVISARCYLVNTTSHCSNATDTACTVEGVTRGFMVGSGGCPTGGTCVAGWAETDFQMTLTKRQPVSWKVTDGLSSFPCDTHGCFHNGSNVGANGSPSSVPITSEDPFFGEIKCVEVDPTTFQPTIGFNPANDGAGDLKGEATIVSVNSRVAQGTGDIDARKYNAVALQSTGVNNGDDTLLVGGDGAEYNGCPNVLIMNHFFDDATVVTHRGGLSGSVTTDLTVIPCGEDFRIQENNLGGATLQFLVFNEFEQRFSASTSFTCWREVQLSDIDSRPGPFGNAQSVFNVGLEGTLTGQTRIRAVEGSTLGNTILGITEEFWECSSGPDGRCSDATNLHFTGTRAKGDKIFLAPDIAP